MFGDTFSITSSLPVFSASLNSSILFSLYRYIFFLYYLLYNSLHYPFCYSYYYFHYYPFTVIPIILCNSCLVLSARLTRHALTRCQLRARSVLILFIIIIYYIYNIVFKESNKKTRKIQKIRYNN